MNATKIVLALSLFLSVCGLQGQEPKEKPPLPAGPIVRPLPEMAEYSVIFTTLQEAIHEGGKGGAGGAEHGTQKVKTIQVTQTGKVSREVETRADGRQLTLWRVNGCTVRIDSKGNTGVIGTSLKNPLWDFGWLSKDNYVSVARVGGAECYVFRDQVGGSEGGSVEHVVMVDIKTQLPVYVVNNGQPQVYAFSAPPTAPLSVPGGVKEVVDKFLK
jgi:hypothetical protein